MKSFAFQEDYGVTQAPSIANRTFKKTIKKFSAGSEYSRRNDVIVRH